jgi:uncharacterized cupin superfamily protein
MNERTNSANEDGIFEPFHVSDVPWQEFSRGAGYGMRYQHLSSFGGATQVGVAMEVLEPGRQANPMHYHMLEEEHVFVMEGQLTVRLGERSYLMTPGHYICFPAGQKVGHALINESDLPCRYLILGNPQKADVAVFPQTGRIDVKLLGTGYRQSATMDYWEGIKTD